MNIKKFKLGKYRLVINSGTIKSSPTNHFSIEAWYKGFPEIKITVGFKDIKYTWLTFYIGYKGFHFHFIKTPANFIKPYIHFYKITYNPFIIKRYLGGK